MTANDAFKTLLSGHIAPLLKPHGLRKQGQTFGLRGEGVWGILNVQKSQWSDVGSIQFTINMAVWSDRLAAIDLYGYGYVPKGIPSEMYCPWRERIGHLLPAGQDIWWSIETPRRSGDPALDPAMVEEVTGAVREHAVPLLLRIRSDHDLLEELQRRPNPCTPELIMIALHSLCSPREEFVSAAERALAAARGSEAEGSLRAALARLGYEEPGRV